MEIYQWVLVIAAAAYLIFRFMPVKGITQISSVEAQEKMMNKQIQFVDVRTAQEFRGKHVAPFRNIPLNEISKRSSDLDKNREVVLICATGIRSAQAAKVLKKQGFETINNVKGGLSAWPEK